MRARRWVPPVLILVGLVPSTLLLLPAGQAAAAPRCGGLAPTVVGTQGPDTLTGTKGPDVIVGLGGNDTLEGLGGDDTLCGGPGTDRLVGGAGDDALYGGLDQLAEGPGGTYLLGDVLLGGAGNDFLDGGSDTRRVDDRRRPDTYSWTDAPSGVVVDLSGTTAAQTGIATGEGTDTLVLGRAHGVVGSAYADTIIGSDRPDKVYGGAGPDTISTGGGVDHVYPDGTADPGGTGGRDVVETGAGSDLVSSLTGRDQISTGRGADFVEAFSSEPTTVDLGPGDDYLGQNVTPGSGADTQGGAGDDVVAFYGALLAGQQPRAQLVIDHRTGTTSTTGEVTATGTIGGVEGHRLVGPLRWGFFGSAAADRVWAIQGGPLRARGGGGADSLTGTALDDLLDGGPGTDTGYRRGGDDTCRSVERGDC